VAGLTLDRAGGKMEREAGSASDAAKILVEGEDAGGTLY
jgi:hypothetical protein